MSADQFEQYEHTYGDGASAMVWVGKSWKGKHRTMCLCFRCARFKPGAPDNCPIAQENYELCVKNDTVQPVFECPVFEYSEKTETQFGVGWEE